MREYKIDASNRVLGRLASEIALILQGKDSPSYEDRLEGETKVIVTNVSKIKITGKKFDQKVYWRHTGYPGGLRAKKLKDLFKKDPAQVLRRAVRGMLPKNKLRDRRMKRLKIAS